MLDLLDFIPPTQHAAIFSGVGVYADDALDDAIAYGLSLGTIPAIIFPAGRLKFASTVHLNNRVTLVGHSSGLQGNATATVCQFDADQTGFVVHSKLEGPGIDAQATVIEGMHLEGAGTVGHGIQLRGSATIRDAKVTGFGGNGVHIFANATTTDPDIIGNANTWLIDTMRIGFCGGHGVFCEGPDSNAGEGRHINASINGGWGIYDSSFLGNTWIACHTADNALGAYKTDNLNARSVLLGCYSESGQPQSEFSRYTLILGGLHGAGLTGGQQIIDGGLSPFAVQGVNSARKVTYRLGASDSAGLDVIAQGDQIFGWSIGWWNEKHKVVQIRHAHLDARWVMMLTTDISDLVDEAGVNIGPGQMVLNQPWVQAPTGLHYRRIDLLAMDERIKALERA